MFTSLPSPTLTPPLWVMPAWTPNPPHGWSNSVRGAKKKPLVMMGVADVLDAEPQPLRSAAHSEVHLQPPVGGLENSLKRIFFFFLCQKTQKELLLGQSQLFEVRRRTGWGKEVFVKCSNVCVQSTCSVGLPLFFLPVYVLHVHTSEEFCGSPSVCFC